MVSFKNEKKERVNVYWTTATVATALNHPKHGKTQLYRRNITMREMALIFENPRVHLNKGYRTNGNRRR